MKVRTVSPSALLFALLPGVALGQQTVPFDELSSVLRRGQTLVVTDNSGEETKGRLQEVSASALVLSVPNDATGRHTFAADRVMRIRRTDSVWNGALIGLAVGLGTGIVLVRGNCTAPDPECEAIVWAALGLPSIAVGTGVGALIDRAVGNGTIYVDRIRAPQRSMTISPVVGRRGSGVRLSLRF